MYQSKSLVNKLFLRNKLYNLRMRDGDSVAEHLNTFNTMVSQLLSIEIKFQMNISVLFYYALYQTRGIVWLWP
jgi:hypothetical protein